jgi:hypothetical protein
MLPIGARFVAKPVSEQMLHSVLAEFHAPH